MADDPPKCNAGWHAKPFALPDPDNKIFKLSDVFGENGLVVAFICNHCPYVKAIGEALVKDAALLKENGMNVVAINPNDYQAYPEDSPAKMKIFAARYGMHFPYLVDEGGATARAYGAVCTPDFFGFSASGELHYRGRIDNVGMTGLAERTPELRNAMLQIMQTGKGPNEQHPSMGCSIKWSS